MMNQIKIPPHSNQSEQSVLGAMMIKPDVIDDVAELITGDDFYLYSNKTIFNAALDLFKSGVQIDLITLETKLSDLGQIDEVGGIAYLALLAKNTPSAANVRAYAQIVKNKSIVRDAINAAMEISELCYASPNEPLELVSEAEKVIGDVSNRLIDKSSKTDIVSITSKWHSYMEALVARKSEIAGISTGLRDLDKKLNGLCRSEMIVLAARPAMGKSTLAVNMVRHEALNGGNPIMFSLEMSAEQIYTKLVSDVGNVSMSALQKPNDVDCGMDDIGWNNAGAAMKRIQETNLEIIDTTGITLPQIRLEVRRYRKRYGNPTLIMIDYLQLIQGEGRSNENRTVEVTKISVALKSLAKEFDCPVLVLSQLNRGLEQRPDKRPTNSDLRESGAIEQDADKIIFIYRDDVYHDNSEFKGIGEIIIGKNRMGEIGKVATTFMGEFSRFAPCAFNVNEIKYQEPSKRYGDQFDG